MKPEDINGWLEEKGSAPLREKGSLYTLLKRPEVELRDIDDLLRLIPETPKIDKETVEQTIIEIKYEQYLSREKQNSEKLDKWESLPINATFNYDNLKALSF